MKTPTVLSHPTTHLALAVLAAMILSRSTQAADFDWNRNVSSQDWSINTNWTPTAPTGGPSAAGVSVLINTNISSTNTLNLFTTGNPGTATKTIGRMDIGDLDGTNAYTIQAGTGSGILNFDGNGSNAQLNELSTSKGDQISAPITLSTSLDITNASANTLTLSAGGIISATAGTKTITTTTGAVTISGVIGDGSGTVAVVQDGSGTLTLSGANTFNGGLTVKNGTVTAGNSVSALGGTGTGAVILGGGAGSGASNASLLFANGLTYANPITVASGGTGIYTIGNSNSASIVLSGGITLNNNATISESNAAQVGYSSGQYINISGAISGSGNLTLAGNGAISTSNSGTPSAVNNLLVSNTVGTFGSITNSGTGTAIVSITGAISNASSLTQNSATSMLILGGANTYTGATNINAGVLRITNATAISKSSAVTVASGATLQINNVSSPVTSPTLTISGNGTSYSTGAIEATNTGGYLGNIVLAADSTVSSDFQNPNAINMTLGTVGSTTITGSGKNLTVTGNNTTTLAGSLNTGAGTLTKLGTGTLTLSGANSFTGLTSINRGTVSLNISTALNGGGNITFGGGTLRHNSTNTADYASRIVNSTGPIAIDTNNQAVTYAGNLAASNTGGLTKIGTGTLTLSGTNSYTGITAVNGGLLAVSVTSALPSGSTIFTDVTGALNQGGAYTGVQGWLASGKVATGSIGAIALTANSSENIDFTGFNNLMLGTTTGFTYTGTITPASTGYRLGGGAGVITLSNTNALTGANALTVGARSGTGTSGGGVTLSAANNLTGATTVAGSTLLFNSGTAGLATSDVTVNRGATLSFSYSSGNLSADNSVTRAMSVQLNGVTLSISGNTGGNTTETITNALTVASGQTQVNVSPAAGKHELLSAGSFVRNSGGTVLFTGTSLGANANSATNVSSANISFGTVTLNGTGTAGGSGTTIGIIAGAYGDTTAGSGTGFGATGGLVTYDVNNGVRLLNTGTEYTSAITSGQSTLDNVRYVNSTASLVTTTLNAATSINSLSLANTGTGGVTITGTGTLKLNSGVIHDYQNVIDAVTISTAGLDFNGQEAIILNQLTNSSATFTINTVISNATGLTKSGSGMLILSGTTANTYTGTTTVNGGNLRLNKTAGVNAVTGDLVINTGANVSMGAANQIADTSNVTINGGTFIMAVSGSSNGGVNETINNLSMLNGATVSYGQSFGNPTFTVLGTASVSGGSTLFQNAGGQLNITGLTSLSDGGTLTVRRSQSPSGIYDGFVTLTGGLDITNTATGAYTPVTINPGINIAQIGGKLFLNGDLTFTGNTTNANTTTIEAITGSGPQGVLALGGTRTFNVGDGAAAKDLTVAAAMVDGASAGGLTKTGAGTLALSGVNVYTGLTTISAGTLVLSSEGTIATSSGVNLGTVSSQGTLDLTAKSSFSFGATQTVSGYGTINIGDGKTVTVAGNLNPGNSPGQVNVTGDVALLSTTVTTMELAGSGGVKGTDFDNVTATGAFTYDGTLSIISFGGFNIFQTGTYSLFDFASQSGNFDSVSFGGNALLFSSGVWSGTNGSFDYSLTLSSGDLAVTAVPEPATWALLAFSLTTAMVLRRRRA